MLKRWFVLSFLFLCLEHLNYTLMATYCFTITRIIFLLLIPNDTLKRLSWGSPDLWHVYSPHQPRSSAMPEGKQWLFLIKKRLIHNSGAWHAGSKTVAVIRVSQMQSGMWRTRAIKKNRRQHKALWDRLTLGASFLCQVDLCVQWNTILSSQYNFSE